MAIRFAIGLLLFVVLPALYRAPEGSGYDARGLLEGKPLPPHEVVHYICDDLRVGLERAFIAEHLYKAPVRVVGGYLAVMDD